MKKESNDMFNQLFSNSIDLLCIITKEGQFVNVNAEWEKILGYSLSDLEGLIYNSFIHSEDIQVTLDSINKLITSNQKESFVNRFRSKQGQYQWIEWRAFLINNNICISGRDISNQKINQQVQDALVKNEKKYRLLFENMTSGFALHQMKYDEKGAPENYIYLEANPSFERLTGLSAELIIGKSIKEVIPDIEDYWVHVFGRVSQTGKPISYIDYSPALGKYFDTYVFSPEKDQFAVVFNDITDRVNAEQNLKESESRFRTMVENMPMPLGVANIDGKIKYINHTFTQLFGYELSEIPTIDKWIELAYPDREYRKYASEVWHQDIEDLFKESINFSIPRLYRISSKYGSAIDVEIFTTVIKNEIYVLFNDITQKNKAENEIRLSEQKFANIYNLSPDMIGITRMSDGKILDGNPAFTKLTGYKSEEYLGKTTLELHLWEHPNDREYVLKQLNETGEVKNFLIKMRIKDGSLLDCLFSARTLTYNEESCLLFILNDITDRQKAALALKDSESILKATMESINDGLVVVASNGNITHCNTRFRQIFAIPENIYFKDTNGLFPYVKKNLSNPSPFESQFIEMHATELSAEDILYFTNGRIVERYSYPLIKDHVVEGRVWVFKDITQRKKTEDTLNDIRKFNDALLESVPGLVYMYDENGNLVRWNKRHVIETGYSDEELSHMHVLDWYQGSESDIAAIKAGLAKANLEGYGTAEAYLQNKNGTKTLYYFTAITTIIDGKNYFTGIGIDITERKMAEVALQKSESILKATMESMKDGLLVVSSDRFISHLNTSFCRIFSIPSDLLASQNDTILLNYAKSQLSNPEIFINQVSKIYSSDKPTEDVLEFADGRIIERFSYPIKNESVNGRVWLFRDVTRSKRAEEEIRKLNTELEKRVAERTIQLKQVNSDLEAFAYSVSHDLRAPLRHVDGFVKMMYAQLTNRNAAIDNYYEKIIAANKRMSSMIDSLLSFSRLGKKELSLSVIDTQTLINEIIEEFTPDLTDRKIKWNISTLPSIRCDRGLMKLAFENLISNAIKYTSKNENAEISIGGSTVEKNIQIYFKDNGIGFDMAYVNKLFGVFQRLHLSSEFEGIGIGLANVKRIIQKHNGQICAEGKVNEGATFYIYLPI